jgi:chitodextrinase
MKRGRLLFVFFAAGLFGAAAFLSARAQSADTTPPSVPSGVTATAIPSLRIQISWTASTDNVGVAGYYIYRNGALIGSTSDLTYTDNVTPGGYSYTVAAYDAAGNVSPNQSLSSPIVMVTSDLIPPSAPTALTATVTTSSVALSWSASTDNIGVAGYYINRNGVRIVASTSSALTATNYTDSGLAAGYTYTYTVIAYDAAGNTSNNSNLVSATTISDITPPSTPFLLSAVTKSYKEVDIAWNPSYDNVKIGGYYVYRDGNQIANVTSTTSYKDVGLSAGTTYFYSVAAYDAAWNVSPVGNSLGATTFPPDTAPPSMPNYFTAKALSTSQIRTTWLSSSDNVGVAGYHLWRSGGQIPNATSTFSSSVQISNTTSTSYLDTGLASGTIYVYTVEAYDDTGNISPQSTVAITTPLTNTTIPASTAPATTTPASTLAPANGGAAFTTTLYFGLRNNEVKKLQLFLIQRGYLGADYATGFFGTLTQGAVQKFQCDQNIVCSGNPKTTGWGLVGVRTRKALNAL